MSQADIEREISKRFGVSQPSQYIARRMREMHWPSDLPTSQAAAMRWAANKAVSGMTFGKPAASLPPLVY